MKVKQLRPGDWVMTAFADLGPAMGKITNMTNKLTTILNPGRKDPYPPYEGLLIAVKREAGKEPQALILVNGRLDWCQASYCIKRISPGSVQVDE